MSRSGWLDGVSRHDLEALKWTILEKDDSTRNLSPVAVYDDHS